MNTDKFAVDSAVAFTGITAPLWVHDLEMWAQLVIMIGGVILIILRVALAIRDWIDPPMPPARRRSDDDDDVDS